MTTMSDIAAEAGVSRSTVSFVLNERGGAMGISDDTVGRVLATAKRLGYRRNEIARAMVSGKSRVIGLLAPEPENEVAARILAGALAAADEHRHFVKVIRFDWRLGGDTVARCVELRLAGVLALYVFGEELEHLRDEMARFGVPVAVLDSSFPQPSGVRVYSDDTNGCRQAVEHLVGLGHRRIAFLAGRPDSGAAALREAGYRAAMVRCGLPVPAAYVALGNFEVETAEQATRALLASGEDAPPTALFCADDKMAMAAVRAARRMGVCVPDDLSIVGFADLSMAVYADPPLTTIAQPFAEMGRVAVRHLLAARLEKPPITTIEDVLPTRLVVRESTAVVHPPG